MINGLFELIKGLLAKRQEAYPVYWPDDALNANWREQNPG